MKIIIFIAWCLCVSAQAQVTKTLNGTVTHNPGYKKTTFNTPAGNVTVITTSDQEELQNGKTLTGSVMMEPSGKNQKEKSKNLSQLKKLLLTVGGTAVALTGTNQSITYSAAPNTGTNNFAINLGTGNGAGAAVNWRTPSSPVNIYSGASQMPMTMNQNLVLGENIISLNAPPFAGSTFTNADEFVVTDSRNLQIPVRPIALSPSTSILELPANIAPGSITVSRTRNNVPVDKVTFNYHDLILSSADRNIRPGQVSSIQAEITHNPDAVMLYPISLQFRNTTPATVSMQNGNMQTITLQGNQWTTTRQLTGLGTGGFSVDVTLKNDDNTTQDPFTTQSEAIKTPEDFNNWTTALQQDLQRFSNAQGNSPVAQNLRSNATRAIEQMSKCDPASSLAECKSFVRQLLQPLNITRSIAESWMSTALAKKLSPSDQNKNALRPTLAGFLDPFSKTLYVQASQKARILASLFATPVTGGYRINSSTVSGKPISYVLVVKEADLPFIADIRKRVTSELDPNEAYDPDTFPETYPEAFPDPYKVPPKTEPPKTEPPKTEPPKPEPTKTKPVEPPKTPKFVKEFTDSSGTAYCFYSEAECKKTWEGMPLGECKPNGDFVNNPVTNESEWKEDGKFRDYEFYASYTCEFGTNYCVMTLQVVGIKYIFADKECKRMVNVIPIISWSCK